MPKRKHTGPLLPDSPDAPLFGPGFGLPWFAVKFSGKRKRGRPQKPPIVAVYECDYGLKVVVCREGEEGILGREPEVRIMEPESAKRMLSRQRARARKAKPR